MYASAILPNNNRAFGGGRGAAVHAEGSKQRGQMDFDGSLAEPQFSRYFLVRTAFHNERKNVFLPGSKRRRHLSFRGGAFVGRTSGAGSRNRRRNVNDAFEDLGQRRRKFLQSDVLGNVPVYPGLQRQQDILSPI
jgi:hypothetical protein